jgi:hypothetical protein
MTADPAASLPLGGDRQRKSGRNDWESPKVLWAPVQHHGDVGQPEIAELAAF